MADEKRHDPFDVESAATRAGFPKSASSGPDWRERAEVAEGFLRALVTAVGSFARENGDELPHVLNLPYSVAANHIRVVDDEDAPKCQSEYVAPGQNEGRAAPTDAAVAMTGGDPRTPDQKRRDADGVDYGDLSKACPSGHNHYCPECGQQHMDGEYHPDCELRGFEHSWNRWERHALDDRVMIRMCDRCGCSERSRLEPTS